MAAAGNALVGERIAAVHAPARARQARPGDPVFVVLSASVEGAHCELSRTIVVGDGPTETQRRWFRSVARAHEAARRRARPGTPASDLDRAARGALREDGLADYLPMRTGHGLGLAPVEAPNLGAGDETPLQPGMVISIEPGVCIPGAGGALWADNYVVTRAGVEPLTAYPIEVSRTRGAFNRSACGTSVSETQMTRERTMRRETLGSRLVATLALLVGLALAGPVAAAPAGTVTFAIPSEPPTVDPAIEVAGPGYRVLFQLYEGLLEYRGNTTELAPALAQSWRVAPDGTSIELKLRPNVKFHDGSALDAETVKASIDRTKAVNRGGAFFLQTLKEVQVVDPMTVRLVATQPSVSLLYGLPKVFITGKAHLADADRGAAFFATGGNGTGPYRLTRWEKGQQIVLDHFADYWRGWSGNHAAQVIQRVVPAAGTQQLLLERGDAHLVVLASIGITQDPKELAAKPGREDGGHPGLPGDRHLDEHPEGPAQGRPPPQGAPGRLRLRGHGAGLQGVRRDPEQPDPQGLHGRVRARACRRSSATWRWRSGSSPRRATRASP